MLAVVGVVSELVPRTEAIECFVHVGGYYGRLHRGTVAPDVE
ncbi:hypothetical protein [Burkholderia glumae]|nr:hypothetical protein [Burkholderia glumae]